ncbi:MAG: dienelactone hydrolase family protein [Gammaproteobacteria bacterium]
MKTGLNAALWLALAMLAAGCQPNVRLPGGVTPVMATWLYGQYAIPAEYTRSGHEETFGATPGGLPWTTAAARALKPGAKVPVVLYLHGCTGIKQQARLYRALLLSQGYAVFMPDSFQRPGRWACGEEGPLPYRVSLRLQELAYAYQQIRTLPWIDQKRIVLMGFSEGGNTVDHWNKLGFAAHIIIGSACTLVGGKPAAPPGTPVLAVVGARDDYRPGLSCTIERTVGGSKSVVISNAGHKVAQYPQTRDAIKAFLHSCCR